LAIVPDGQDRLLLQTIASEAGWIVSFSGTTLDILSGRLADVPPIVIYDRDFFPNNWREAVAALSKVLPRPYVILLAANLDNNLLDELQRLGGSDILRKPARRDDIAEAVKTGWMLWRSQQQVRSLLKNRM